MKPERKDKLILQRASELFADRGFESVTMDEIASAAGISKGTIYLYFRSKTDLIATLLEQNVNSVLRILKANPRETESFGEFIFNLYDRIMNKAKEIKRPFIHSPPHSLSSELKAELKKRIVEPVNEIKRRFTELFKIGIERGEIKAFPPEGLANFFMGMLFFASHEPETYIKKRKQMLDIFFYGIMKEEGKR